MTKEKMQFAPPGNFPIHPLLLRQISRCEGLDREDLFGPDQKEPFMVYLSAPLQATAKKPSIQHIAEAALAAAQIAEASYQGRYFSIFVPHLGILPIFNELTIPQRRKPAMLVNTCCLEKCHAVVIVGRRISPGMTAEIKLAEQEKIPVMSLSAFKKQLTSLPSPEKSQIVFASFIKDLPPKLFSPRIIRRKSPQRKTRS